MNSSVSFFAVVNGSVCVSGCVCVGVCVCVGIHVCVCDILQISHFNILHD